MFLVIPEIELEAGQCKYCIVGEAGTESIYKDFSEHPDKLAKLWRRENAKSIYITDSDSFKGNYINNESIILTANSVDIPIQLFYSFRNYEECIHFLRNNIYRLVIDCSQDNAIDFAVQILEDFYQSKVSVFYKLENIEQFLAEKKLLEFIEIGINRFVLNVESIQLNEENLSTISTFAIKNEVKLSIYGGIENAQQLWQLQEYRRRNIDSVIINKPFYENAFPCQKIWRLIEANLEYI